MATNKNQHFVPRVYLRQFAVEGIDRQINLFRINSQKFVPGAALRHQCSGDYFYGNNAKLEEGIQHMERAYALTIRKIAEPSYVLGKDDKEILLVLWLLQYLRTEAASRKSVEFFEATKGVATIDHSAFSMQIREAVQVQMQTFVQEMDSVKDLSVCLIRNVTDSPFITSDDPAVLTNRWHLRSQLTRHYSFGLGSAGTILLLPLTPEILFIGYDSHIYRIPKKNGWARIRNVTDVIALNQHQFLNCFSNIYVRRESDAGFVKDSFNQIKRQRLAETHRVHYATLDETTNMGKKYRDLGEMNAEDQREAIIHTQTLHPKPTRWPSCLKWQSNPYAYYNGTGVGYVRNPDNCSLRSSDFDRVKVSI